MNTPVLQIAVPSPLHGSFDYLPPKDADVASLCAGMRVRVPFGRRQTTGVLLNITDHTEVSPDRLRSAFEVLDPHPVIAEDLMGLARWASAYYHYPIGEVLNTVLPVALRSGRPVGGSGIRGWRLTETGRAVVPDSLGRARRQAEIVTFLLNHPEGAGLGQMREAGLYSPAALKALRNKDWIEAVDIAADAVARSPVAGPPLNEAQKAAVGALHRAHGYVPVLLEGVTGSGKTEVYLHAISDILTQGRQTLVLVPEIGLTPQLVRRFERRLGVPLAVMHSAMTDRERLNAWLAAARGDALVVIGTRSAVFTPLANPGLFIVDEEHDASLKQQEGFRYSARDLLVWRARHLQVPVVLGSATPSLESLQNVRLGRYQCLELPERAGGARPPSVRLLDVRAQAMEDNLSRPLVNEIGQQLEAGGQVLLFLNRRGYAPTLLCHDCGWVAECRRCDAHMVLHHDAGELRCHHCGGRRQLVTQCPECGCADLRALGSGTERVEKALQRYFPDRKIVRIDRDSVRRKGQLDTLLGQARKGEAEILLGTQMLAKGHHFPGVTLVGILNTDQQLFSSDFRASERMAQLIVQVAGRAGRADRPGQVLIQTHHPEHPLLRLLIERGYSEFARAALVERKAAALPPFTSMALLRAEAVDRDAPESFLGEARSRVEACGENVSVWGPVPSPMEKRQGRFRAQLMLVSPDRAGLHRLLEHIVSSLDDIKASRRVRWSLDVDPVDSL